MSNIITVQGATHRDFTFPTNPQTALAYYSDIPQLVSFLPHISVVEQFSQREARALYRTRELTLYTIRIYCDLQQTIDYDEQVLYMQPLTTQPVMAPQSGYRNATAHGRFSSESRFVAEGSQTRIDYQLSLHAQLPPPRGLNLLPGNILDQISASITKGRIREIADGFIKKSIAYFPIWQKKQGHL